MGGKINSSYSWNLSSTLDLTLNVKMRNEYVDGNKDNFINGIKCALCSSFVTMIKNRIKIAVIPKLSSAIYSKCMEGKLKGDNKFIDDLFKDQTNKNIVSQVINQKYKRKPIKDYFELIVIADLGRHEENYNIQIN